MILTKWKQAPTKVKRARINQAPETCEDLAKTSKFVSIGLGHYDVMTIMEASAEKDAMKVLLPFQNIVETETMVAVQREEATKLL